MTDAIVAGDRLQARIALGIEQHGPGAGGLTGLAIVNKISDHQCFLRSHMQPPRPPKQTCAAGFGRNRIVTRHQNVEIRQAERVEILQGLQYRSPAVAGDDADCECLRLIQAMIS